MALTPIVTDGTETGATSATKINTAFTQINTNTTNITTLTNDIVTNTANITTNTTDIAALDTRVTTNETGITDLDARVSTLELNTDTAIAVRGINPSPQALIANTPTKLIWMTDTIVDSGYSSLSFNIGANEFYVNETAIYKVFGTITFVAPTNDNLTFTLYNNGIPTNFQAYAVGKSNTQRVSVSWTAMESLSAGDILSIYVESDGTEVNVTYGNLVMERTSY